jgi:flagellar hook assembly protein FlgD
VNTATATQTNTPINTWTPTATPMSDEFWICKNVFNMTIDPQVCITIGTAQSGGMMELKIYNSAGEHIKTLYSQYLNAPMPPTTFNWDGTNKYGQKVASGVYVVYLMKPYGRLLARLAVIH